MMRWFHALMPKEERFFDLFARHSKAVLAGAEALRAMLEGGEAIAAQLPDRHGPRAGRRRRDPRGADRGAPHLHHAVRPRQHPRPDHLDGQHHRPDAEDRQGHHAVRRDRVHAADEGDGGRDREMRATGAGRRAAAALDQFGSRAYQHIDRADFAARRPRRRVARYRPQDALSDPRQNRTRWPFSSATRSTIIWKKSSTASTTWPMSCTASSSSTCK